MHHRQPHRPNLHHQQTQHLFIFYYYSSSRGLLLLVVRGRRLEEAKGRPGIQSAGHQKEAGQVKASPYPHALEQVDQHPRHNVLATNDTGFPPGEYGVQLVRHCSLILVHCGWNLLILIY
jgi:hypothetical protein